MKTKSFVVLTWLMVSFLTTHSSAQNILYDNGPFFGQSKGLSIWTPPNPRRSLLDDFELAPGGGTINAWSTWMVWGELQGPGHASKVELTFYGDVNGTPDFNNQIAFVSTTDIEEVLEGSQVFNRDIIIMTARFPGVFIPDGRTWVDMIWFEPSGDISFLLTSKIKFTESWTDYEDFPPPGPGRNVFGEDSDLIFTLYGTPTPCLNLTVDNLIAGKNATFTITNGTPGARAVTVFGTQPGQTIIKNLANYCATFGIKNINQTKIIGGTNRIFGAAGKITFNQKVPQQAKNLTVLFQSAQQNTCPDECVSNLVEMTVQ